MAACIQEKKLALNVLNEARPEGESREQK